VTEIPEFSKIGGVPLSLSKPSTTNPWAQGLHVLPKGAFKISVTILLMQPPPIGGGGGGGGGG